MNAKVVEFKSELDDLPDGGTLTIRPLEGQFVDNGDKLYGFFAYDTDHSISICLNLPLIPDDPIDLIRVGLSFGDKSFEQLLKKAIEKQRDIKCGKQTLTYGDYSTSFVKGIKPAKIENLAPHKLKDTPVNNRERDDGKQSSNTTTRDG